MRFSDEIRQQAEQVRRRVTNVKSEKATKQALFLPRFLAFGCDVYDLTEKQPQFVSEFAKKQSGGAFETLDDAILLGGVPVMLVECTVAGSKPHDADGQLAQCFNATTTAKVGGVTSGTRSRFVTDIQPPNLTDPKLVRCHASGGRRRRTSRSARLKWTRTEAATRVNRANRCGGGPTFDVLSFADRDADSVSTFASRLFNAVVQSDAEDMTHTQRIMTLVNRTVRGPHESFVRYLLGENDPVSGRGTSLVMGRLQPNVRRSIQPMLVETMTGGLQKELESSAQTAAPAAASRAGTTVGAVAPTAVIVEGVTGATDWNAAGSGWKVVTTADEFEAIEAVKASCAESWVKSPVSHKDVAGKSGINLGKVSCIFVRTGFKPAEEPAGVQAAAGAGAVARPRERSAAGDVREIACARQRGERRGAAAGVGAVQATLGTTNALAIEWCFVVTNARGSCVYGVE